MSDEIPNDEKTDEEWEAEIEAAKLQMPNLVTEEVAVEEEKVAPEIPMVPIPTVGGGFDEPELIREPPKKEPEAVDDKKVADLSTKIFMTSGDIKALAAQLNDIKVTPETAEHMLEDESHLIKLGVAVATNTKRSRFQYKELLDVADNLVKGSEIVSSSGLTLTDKRTNGTKFGKVKNVTGDAAVLNIQARIRSFRRLLLPNSGFHIDTRPLEAIEIKNILDSIDVEQKELGRILGGYFYLLEDVFFVQKVMDLLPSVVVDSNLEDFKAPHRLAQAISIFDYDVILGSFCSDMYKNGVKYKLLCPELHCNYSETVHINFDDLKLYDFTKLPKEAVEMLFSPETFTKERYRKYQELIGGYDIVPVDELRDIKLKVPSIFNFVRFGSYIVSTIITQLYSQTKRPEDVELKDLRNIYYYKNFISWVEKITCKLPEPDEDGDIIDFETSEPEAIDKILESDLWEDNPNRDRLLAFFSKSKVTHFAYLGRECPICHKVPDPNTNGYIPIDVSNFFFNLSLYRLSRGRG